MLSLHLYLCTPLQLHTCMYVVYMYIDKVTWYVDLLRIGFRCCHVIHCILVQLFAKKANSSLFFYSMYVCLLMPLWLLNLPFMREGCFGIYFVD